MMEEEVKHILIVKVPKGLNILDTPRPQSMGASVRRAVAVGTELKALSIHKIEGVPYARLLPQVPSRPEWVRVAEADHSLEYVDVIDLEPATGGTDQLVLALIELANSNTLLASAMHEIVRNK